MSVNKIKGLDGVRALSVSLVVLTHLGILQRLPDRVYETFQGTTGVITFFSLSGFLITHLLIREYEKTDFVSLKNFYIRRTLRIVPLYLTVILLIAAINVFTFVAKRSAIAFALIYATNFVDKGHYSTLLGHTWSIAVEEHFYLVWPFIFSLFIKGNWKIASIVLAVTAAFALLSANILYSISYLNDNFFLDRWTFVAAGPIAMGALVAVFVTTRKFNKMKTAISKPVMLAAALAILCHSLAFPNLPFHLLDFLRGIGAALTIGWLFLNQHSWAVKFLEFRPLRYVGVISYGVYIWQGFFLATGPERVPGQFWPPGPLIGLSLLAVVAPLSFHFFEQPILRLKRRYER
jgi:peptidoglycan/LPS O-acetylase OafA/YrhL